jgi:hypothetical protein
MLDPMTSFLVRRDKAKLPQCRAGGTSSGIFWIPAFASMTDSRQAAGNAPDVIQNKEHIR